MNLIPLGLEGAFLIELERRVDDRGWFARTFDAAVFEAHGLDAKPLQTSVSFNPVRGTFRGLHYQAEPDGESKLVRCTRGVVHDVAVDIRPSSPTFRRAIGLELRAGGDGVYLPAGVAHGFLTLEDDTEVAYQMAQPYVAASASGVRWDDPAFEVRLPAPITLISERDATFPDFTW